MSLKEIRKQFNLSQSQAAIIAGVPLRTYIRYESDNEYGSKLKRLSLERSIIETCEITETKGLLTVDTIKNEIKALFDNEYHGEIEFCYLFGSYAKGYAKENSDIDLCVSTKLTGFKFIGISERIRQRLHKRIDLIKFSNLNDNIDLLSEILKNGVKIYG